MTYAQAASLPTSGYLPEFDGLMLKDYRGGDKALIATGILTGHERFFYVRIHSDGFHDYFKYKGTCETDACERGGRNHTTGCV